jgi:hypothetical protein
MRRMGALHPQVVHFAIALLFVGVAFRAVSLLGRPAYLGPAAATLLLLGTLAAVVAAYTGDAAHGPIEQMPGLRPAVTAHEEWGERARNIFLVVLLAEAAALALADLNIEFYPQSARSYLVKGMVQSRQLDTDGAIASFKKTLELEPENGVAQGWLIQMEQLARRGR